MYIMMTACAAAYWAIVVKLPFKPSFHMVVNVSRLCRQDRVRVYLDDTSDTAATRSRPYGN